MIQMETECQVCKKPVGSGHRCKICNRSVHLFCGTSVGEESYGQEIECFSCKNEGKEPLRLCVIDLVGFFVQFLCTT